MTSIKDTVAECIPHKNPLLRPDYTEFEVQAIRALARGKASERQQIAALEYMVRAFGTHDISYRPDDPHGTAFSEGKRFAGTTLVWMLKSAPTRTDPDKTATREMDDDE
jgi:hypothetical protein